MIRSFVRRTLTPTKFTSYASGPQLRHPAVVSMASRGSAISGPMGRSGQSTDDIQRVLAAPALRRLNKLFTDNGFELRLVGGIVRDLLNGNRPHDIDLATPALPEQVIEVLTTAGLRVIETGLKHGTVTAVVDGEQFEITTLRVDTDPDGRHCTVEYTHDWRLDAERRDLTFNAMSMGLDGKLYDYFGGEEHLRESKVLFVGDPMARIEEDYLRILRYFRFHGRLSVSGVHDPSCLEAIRTNHKGLEQISGERIRSEMIQILSHPSCAIEIEQMADVGLMDLLMVPAIDKFHLNELQRVCKLSSDPITRLVSIIDTEEDLTRLSERWRLTNDERDYGLWLIANRSSPRTLEAAQDILVESVPGHTKAPRKYAAELLRYQGKSSLADSIERWSIPEFPLTGKVLVSLGIKPGKQMGALLRTLKDDWKVSRFSMTLKELEYKAERLSE